MIICLTPNPALDITYRTDAIRIGEVNRIELVAERAGGKGVNVARVLHALGEEVRLLLPLGGATGALIRERLRHDGYRVDHLQIDGETRRTITVLAEGSHPSGLYEPGPRLDSSDWRRLTELALALLESASTLVISGSLPPGIAATELGDLVAAARRTGAVVVVDTSGDALVESARAGASVLKPNLDELRGATGCADWVDGARTLLENGASTVVVSLGPQGLAVCSDLGVHLASGLGELEGNPTGAGDAVVASVVSGLRSGADAARLAREAYATGAAAVLEPEAGSVDPERVRSLLRGVRCEEIPWH